MKQELIKPIVRVGNSAGVLLPREWLNGRAKIELVEEPIDIKRDVLEIIGDYLENIIGIYIIGSYARSEQKEGSDIDILIITKDTDKKIKKGRYDLLLISAKTLKKELENNLLPLLPMIREAKPLLNSIALDDYKNAKFTKKNIRFHIETTKSALAVIDKAIALAEIEGRGLSENIVYSLVLRLREVYIVDCLKNSKIATTKEFVCLIKKLTESDKAYRLYLNVKNDKKRSDERISVEEAEKIRNYIIKKIKEQEV
jgi:predicted nucleotidyltransferase